MLLTGRPVVEQILLAMRELWGSIMTEEQAEICRRPAELKVSITFVDIFFI